MTLLGEYKQVAQDTIESRALHIHAIPQKISDILSAASVSCERRRRMLLAPYIHSVEITAKPSTL